MESSTTTDTNYLHKKFKKQLSIEPRRIQQNENKSPIVESCQEKAPSLPPTHLNNHSNQQQNDNNSPPNENVPIFIQHNNSTNQNGPASYSKLKSSISSQPFENQPAANLQSNTCISFVATLTNNNPSFDTTTRILTATTTTSSTLLDKSIFSATSHEPQPDETPPKTATSGKYVCPYCNLVCSKPSVLEKHIRAHTNERPYPCDSCGFSFKTRSNLYKHCRSRTHANRVMGNKVHESSAEQPPESPPTIPATAKPYKPRFHTKQFYNAKDPEHDEQRTTESTNSLLSEHINDIITKNHSIVNSIDAYPKKADNNNEYNSTRHVIQSLWSADEPLNLSSKNRKRSLSEIVEPKSLIKELLLKTLSSDLQCPHCKMIFQTGTELELHKMRSCRGFVKPGAKYVRSSSVNVASILTQNRNAFDSIALPLKSPGPFLGKTRLVESDRTTKSYSFDDGFSFVPYQGSIEREKSRVKLFGGEVKIAANGAASKAAEAHQDELENRVVRSGLQSGGTVRTNRTGSATSDVRFDFEPDVVKKKLLSEPNSSPKFANISDFSQNAVKLLTPNLKQPNLGVPGIPEPFFNPLNLYVNGKVVRHIPGIPGPVVDEPMETAAPYSPAKSSTTPKRPSPLTLNLKEREMLVKSPEKVTSSPVKSMVIDKLAVQVTLNETKKFVRPNSLALKPTTASLKQHHGLTPTVLNQILISPDTPRVAKKYNHHCLQGNYFSYLGLKSSTKPVYCTLNKTQPFYATHFQKLSMYSEWRQQDTKTDKLYGSGYDSRQKMHRYTTAGCKGADLVVHSSYKFIVGDSTLNKDENSDEQPKSSTILGGYECNEDYTYIRGRGRGRYVCDQCGIRCKKPSMLKKHIRTHSNDRPFTCNHCNFSFKTKGNLTKHMKSKAHTLTKHMKIKECAKNYAVSGSSSSSTQQSGTQSSESDTDDSGMDSSDESTRREEHEAAYGLLSLSQKTSNHKDAGVCDPSPMNADEIVHIQKSIFARNKFLDEKQPIPLDTMKSIGFISLGTSDNSRDSFTQFVGKTRPLTYPYTSPMLENSIEMEPANDTVEDEAPKCIKQFHVIQKYAPSAGECRNSSAEDAVHKIGGEERTKVGESRPPPILKVNDTIVVGEDFEECSGNKRQYDYDANNAVLKRAKNDEVMDLSIPQKNQLINALPSPTNNFVINISQNNANGMSVVNINYNTNISEVKNMQNLNKVEYDNSAMETLADIATKQVKLEKNVMARSVASEFLKIATKNECNKDGGGNKKELNELMVRPEGSKNCHICTKSFNKMSQLKLHMNIHYLERPFRCHSCSVSFRTKGHLQKHERSASHHNKLSSSPALSSSEPRPFKCVDCSIAFRIHGHLAKHLRSKMHIMKLECLAKIPFGLYAELERSNSLLTEINTADGDQCLESLKTLAKKVFINDPGKLNQVNSVELMDTSNGTNGEGSFELKIIYFDKKGD